MVLQAEHAELLRGLPLVASWTAPRELATLAEQHVYTEQLLEAYQRLRASDPARLAAIEQQARRYARVLRTLGIADPWELELNTARRGRVAGLALALALLFLPAVAGFALSYGPYRLARPLTPVLLGKYEETTSTGKLIIGTVMVLLGWVLAATVCAMLAGWAWAALLLLLAPAMAYAALRWGELWREFREVLAYSWMVLRHGALVRALAERRQALAEQVRQAVQSAEG